jgi:hypothetical protein
MRAFATLAERDMHRLSGKNLAWALNAVKALHGYSALFLAAATRLLQVCGHVHRSHARATASLLRGPCGALGPAGSTGLRRTVPRAASTLRRRRRRLRRRGLEAGPCRDVFPAHTPPARREGQCTRA